MLNTCKDVHLVVLLLSPSHPASMRKTAQKKFPGGSVCSLSFPASVMLLSREYSQGAVLILFVLLCMDSITSCIPAVSLCIQLTDQRRQPASAYTPVHSKDKHSRG